MKDSYQNNSLGNAIIIYGSSRSDGNTRAAIKEFDPDSDITFVDLNDLDITPFDYEHKNQYDDYIPLMEMIARFDHIILATPVYWYSMSAQIKIFIDRLTDLLTIRKDIGRKLRSKKLSVFPTSAFFYRDGKQKHVFIVVLRDMGTTFFAIYLYVNRSI